MGQLMSNIFDLNGKTAFITGASQGLGARFAELLASKGVLVILAARQINKLNQIVSKITNTGGRAMALQLDVTRKSEVESAITNLLVQQKIKVDILINSAGVSLLTPVFQCKHNDDSLNQDDDTEGFEKIMATNVMGTWFVSRIIANHMKQHNIHGSIINIASVCGSNKLRSNLTGYAASKAAVMQMTKAMVGELATANIRINCIVPGLIHTPMTDHRIGDEEARRNIENTIPLHFVATPQDFDGTLLYLASNHASRYTTGACITVDGGVSWGGAYDYYLFKGVIY